MREMAERLGINLDNVKVQNDEFDVLTGKPFEEDIFGAEE